MLLDLDKGREPIKAPFSAFGTSLTDTFKEIDRGPNLPELLSSPMLQPEIIMFSSRADRLLIWAQKGWQGPIGDFCLSPTNSILFESSQNL